LIWEDEMAFVLGRVSKILRDPDGNSIGMLMDDGQKIRFPAAFGRLVSPVITEGCLVGVEGDRSAHIFPESRHLASTSALASLEESLQVVISPCR
jgi:hypothetical protein